MDWKNILSTVIIAAFLISCDSGNPADATSLKDTVQGTLAVVVDKYTFQGAAVSAHYDTSAGGKLILSAAEPSSSVKMAKLSISIPSSYFDHIGTYPIKKKSVSGIMTYATVDYSDLFQSVSRIFESDSINGGAIMITECDTINKRISGGYSFTAVRTDPAGANSGQKISGYVNIDNIMWK